MPKLVSDVIGPELLQALGIDSRGVLDFTLCVKHGKPVAISVTQLEIPNGVGGITEVAEIIKRYELVERDPLETVHSPRSGD